MVRVKRREVGSGFPRAANRRGTWWGRRQRRRSFQARWLAAFVALVWLGSPWIDSMNAATRSAVSCSQADVLSAIAAASDGDVVQVPAGTCTWSGLAISKAIHLQGTGAGQTQITLTGPSTVTKQAAGITRISGFGFFKSGGGNASRAFIIIGSWRSAEPVIFQNNSFTITATGLFRVQVAGGVIFANNAFLGDWDDSFLQLKDDQDSGNSWRTADTIGTRDTDGRYNIYIESNTFTGGTNQGIDADDSARVVVRYNTFDRSSVNSHGWDTSPVGVRHWEIYNNTFVHPGGWCTTQLCNQNWLTLLRGGTGVITENQFVDIAGGWWGDKPEMHIWIRGAEDIRPQGSCGSVSYPVPRQLGQNHNGISYFTDPVAMWNNSGAQVVSAGWTFGNPCGLTFSDFWRIDRDYALRARPGYAKYIYPHPLLSGAAFTGTTSGAPANLRIIGG